MNTEKNPYETTLGGQKDIRRDIKFQLSQERVNLSLKIRTKIRQILSGDSISNFIDLSAEIEAQSVFRTEEGISIFRRLSDLGFSPQWAAILTLLILAQFILFNSSGLTLAQDSGVSESMQKLINKNITAVLVMTRLSNTGGITSEAEFRIGQLPNATWEAAEPSDLNFLADMSINEINEILEYNIDETTRATGGHLFLTEEDYKIIKLLADPLTEFSGNRVTVRDYLSVLAVCRNLDVPVATAPRVGFLGVRYQEGEDGKKYYVIDNLSCLVKFNNDKEEMWIFDRDIAAMLNAYQAEPWIYQGLSMQTMENGTTNPIWATQTKIHYRDLLTGKPLWGYGSKYKFTPGDLVDFEVKINALVQSIGLEDNICKLVEGTDGHTYEIQLTDHSKMTACVYLPQYTNPVIGRLEANTDTDYVNALAQYISATGLEISGEDKISEIKKIISSSELYCEVSGGTTNFGLMGTREDGTKVCVPFVGFSTQTNFAISEDIEAVEREQRARETTESILKALLGLIAVSTTVTALYWIDKRTRYLTNAYRRTVKWLNSTRPEDVRYLDKTRQSHLDHQRAAERRQANRKTQAELDQESFEKISTSIIELRERYKEIYNDGFRDSTLYNITSSLRALYSLQNTIIENAKDLNELQSRGQVYSKQMVEIENLKKGFANILNQGFTKTIELLNSHRVTVPETQYSAFNNLIELTIIKEIEVIFEAEQIEQIRSLKFETEQKVVEQPEIEISPKANLIIQNGEMSLLQIEQNKFRENFELIQSHIGGDDKRFVRKADAPIINILNTLIEKEVIDFEKLGRLTSTIVEFHQTINTQGNEIALTVKLNNGKYVLITADRNEWPERTISIEIVDESKYIELKALKLDKEKRKDLSIKGLSSKETIHSEINENTTNPSEFAGQLVTQLNQGFTKEELTHTRESLRSIKDNAPIYWIELISELAKLINKVGDEDRLGLGKIIVSSRALNSYLYKSNPTIVAEKLLYRLAGIRVQNADDGEAFTPEADRIITSLITAYNDWAEENEIQTLMDKWQEGTKCWLIRDETRIQIADIEATDGRKFIVPIVTWHGH